LSAEPQHVIVGAGVIGLALAYELLRRDRRVLVLERARPAGGATAAAAGMLAPVSEARDEPSALIDLGIDSLRRFPRFVVELERLTGLDCGYRDEGTLWVALDRDGRAELRHLGETLARKGLDALELDAEELRRVEPHLSPRALGGMRVAGDHQVDPRSLGRCLAEAVDRLGGEVRSGRSVRRVETRNARVAAVAGVDANGDPFRIETANVIIAAGAWSEQSIELPLEPTGLRAVKGQLLRLKGPRVLSHVVRTPEIYLVPRADGELLIGGTVEEMGFDEVPTAGAAMDLLRRGWEVLPAIYEFELVEHSVGLRPALDDPLPRIGATETEGLSVAFGHFRSGVLLAPATAHYLAEWLIAGRQPVELQPFAPERRAGHCEAGRV
jgi:glycine oxidase